MGRLRRPYGHLAPIRSLCPVCGNYLSIETLRVSTDQGATWQATETQTCLRRHANPPTARCCNKRTVSVESP